jgi:hypothetical protein
MGMSEPIVVADLQALSSGLTPGINKDQSPFWYSGQDVIFAGSSVRPCAGFDVVTIYTGMFDEHTGNFDSAAGLFDAANTAAVMPTTVVGEPVKGVHQQKQRNGKVLICVGSDTSLLTFDSALGITSSYTNLNGTTAATEAISTTMWSFEQWGDWVAATNGVDTPRLLKKGTSDTFAVMGGFASVATSCEILRTLGPHMLAFNTNNGANQLLACKPDDIETWDYTTVPTAVELTMRDFQGPVIAVERLGQSLLAYGEQGMHVVSYGGPFLIGALPGPRGIKAVSKNSIAVVGGLHYALQESGIVKTDGVTVAPVAVMQLGDWPRRAIDWAQRSRICSAVDTQRAQIKWSVPEVGASGNSLVLTYNYQTDTIGFESIPFSAACLARGLITPLFGFANGGVKTVVDSPIDRAPFLCTKPLPLNNRQTWVYIDVLQVRVNGSGLKLYGRYGSALGDFDDAAVSNPWTLLDAGVGVDESFCYLSREMIYLQLKLTGDIGALWHLSGIDAHGAKGGRRF